jgi:surfeit locus 1 family protein
MQKLSRRFQFNWKVTLFAWFFCIVFVYLGFWQITREQEKVQLLADRAEQAERPPLSVDALSLSGEPNGTLVRLQGHFGDLVGLLDNRVLDGQVGFEVQQLFTDVGGQRFLVNRGFVSMGRTRSDTPSIPSVPEGLVTIDGVTYQPEAPPFQLDDAPIKLGPGLTILQRIETSSLADILEIDLYPSVIRIREGEAGALPRYWPDTVMSPARHKGYAIQWFTMAFAVVVAWLFFSFRQEDS